jgi:hypothetical protein
LERLRAISLNAALPTVVEQIWPLPIADIEEFAKIQRPGRNRDGWDDRDRLKTYEKSFDDIDSHARMLALAVGNFEQWAKLHYQSDESSKVI